MAHLIASIGTAPAILTEAIWWIEKERGLAVHGLTCVGTATSMAKAQREVFEEGGALDRLRRYLKKDPNWLGPAQIRWEAEPLEAPDNRNREEAMAMDRAFRRAICNAQAVSEEPVVACISGGRKTMSSSLQQAMAMLARPQDLAFVVLLNAPDEKIEQVVQGSGWGFPGDAFPKIQEAGPLHELQSQGRLGIDGIVVPLVRLRHLFLLAKVDPTDPDLVTALQRGLDDVTELPNLVLDLSTLKLQKVVKGISFPLGKLSPTDAMLLGALIRAGEMTQPPALRSHVEWMIRRWDELELCGTKLIPASIEALRSTANYIFNSEQVATAFAQAKSKLQKKLRIWLKDPHVAAAFAIESDPKSTLSPRPVGFGPEIYRGRKIHIHE